MEGVTYEFKTTPFSHQLKYFNETAGAAVHALFWEQGAAKSKPVIDDFAQQFLLNKIDAVIVVAPPGVHRNWVTDELPAHLPDAVAARTSAMFYQGKRASTKWHKTALEKLIKYPGLAFLSISYDSFNTPAGKKFIWRLLQRRRCFYVLDESHAIKAPGSKRAHAIVASGVYAPFRRILSGTYCPEGPFDVYSQIKFLDETFWPRHGITTFAEYRAFFGIYKPMPKFMLDANGNRKKDAKFDPRFDLPKGYRNLDKLQEWLKEISTRVLKDEVLDLPEKVYAPKRYFEMTPEQDRLYRELERDYTTVLDGKVIDAELAITRMLRFQQIVCGYLKSEVDEPEILIPGGNPRLKLMEDIRDGFKEKTIVWARFRKDIDQLMDLLGERAVRYDGKIDEDECARSKDEFKKGDAQWFVATQAKGKEGITLTEAHHVVYYSQTFKLLDRLQSEDRPHRAGLTHSVDYTDLVCLGTVDEKIVNALRKKLDIASQITGDTLRDWI